MEPFPFKTIPEKETGFPWKAAEGRRNARQEHKGGQTGTVTKASEDSTPCSPFLGVNEPPLLFYFLSGYRAV